jgi:hypothetical protein
MISANNIYRMAFKMELTVFSIKKGDLQRAKKNLGKERCSISLNNKCRRV